MKLWRILKNFMKTTMSVEDIKQISFEGLNILNKQKKIFNDYLILTSNTLL